MSWESLKRAVTPTKYQRENLRANLLVMCWSGCEKALVTVKSFANIRDWSSSLSTTPVVAPTNFSTFAAGGNATPKRTSNLEGSHYGITLWLIYIPASGVVSGPICLIGSQTSSSTGVRVSRKQCHMLFLPLLKCSRTARVLESEVGWVFCGCKAQDASTTFSFLDFLIFFLIFKLILLILLINLFIGCVWSSLLHIGFL